MRKLLFIISTVFFFACNEDSEMLTQQVGRAREAVAEKKLNIVNFTRPVARYESRHERPFISYYFGDYNYSPEWGWEFASPLFFNRFEVSPVPREPNFEFDREAYEFKQYVCRILTEPKPGSKPIYLEYKKKTNSYELNPVYSSGADQVLKGYVYTTQVDGTCPLYHYKYVKRDIWGTTIVRSDYYSTEDLGSTYTYRNWTFTKDKIVGYVYQL